MKKIQLPQQSDDIDEKRQAWAPYNFVPLPDQIVTQKVTDLPDQGIYHKNRLTGYIDCELTTESPIYIRAGVNRKQIEEGKQSKDIPDFFYLNDANEPVIPGSSLRGMIRTLVEIVTYSKLRWINNSPTITYRAVADKNDDPLKQKYKDIIGNMAKNVRAGYFIYENDKWYIQPVGSFVHEKIDGVGSYLKVDEEDIDIANFIKMPSIKDYRPQLVEVSFQRNGITPKRADLIKKAREKNKTITDPNKQIKEDRVCYLVKSKDENLINTGWLITAGNMRETGSGTPNRYKHYIFPPKNEKAERYEVPDQVVRDYRAGLTPFQRERLVDWRDGIHDESWGCLGNGKPVFYVLEEDQKVVRFFGHNPNFRIPVMLEGTKRAVTPLDFVPKELRYDTNPDLADGLFGWVEQWDEEDENGQITKKQIGPTKQYAGRLFFRDAIYLNNKNGVWLTQDREAVTPRILASPKPASFQHYLIQDNNYGHDPNNKSSLAHYGTNPTQTGIRGYKFYWHKGSNPAIEYAPKNDSEKRPDNVLTQIIPIKQGVCFSSRIHFENLLPEELGVLCWALVLPGKKGKTYRHKIGMAKPLGMGAVKITLSGLHISQRFNSNAHEGRYTKLTNLGVWFQPELQDKQPIEYISAFEKFLSEKGILDIDQKLYDVPRIKELFELLEWRGVDVDQKANEVTRYMEITHYQNGNEYKDRRVLPAAGKVFAGWFRENANVNTMVDELKERAVENAKIETQIKDPRDLKPGDRIRNSVVIYAEKSGDVELTNPEYGNSVEFVIRDEDRDKLDRYIKNKMVFLEVLSVVKEISQTSNGEFWIVYCKKA